MNRKKFIVIMDKEIHKEMKILAVQKECRIGDLIEEMFRYYLSAMESATG